MQTDLATGRRFVSLRTQYKWNADSDTLEPSWEFLDAGRRALVGMSARRLNLEHFWRYVPVFYLGALRDVSDEFSTRSSQFWTRLLKDLNIPPGLESRALRVLDLLNRRLLKADPRLGQIAETLTGATNVATREQDGELGLRMVPLKTWDLLPRAEIILRNEPDTPWLPLGRQGQGIQSLSVIFLFQAFVEHLLASVYEDGSEPVLALEEPETHLHPQAVRALWRHIEALPGQKIVTTHSPYFVQHVPFRDLRLVRLTDGGTEVRSLPGSFTIDFPHLDGLESLVDGSDELLTYDRASELLTVHGALDHRTYRALLSCCGTDSRRAELEARLRGLNDESALYVTDDELQALETSARRMRGEIFFAERWLLVEGQSDVLIVHAIADAMDYGFDRYGVSVIDVQNNGSPATFAALAAALGIPWRAVFDGDEAGRKHVQAIENRVANVTAADTRCATHAAGDLEQQLVADGLGPELRGLLAATGIQDALILDDEALVEQLRKSKTRYAAGLVARMRADPKLAERSPIAFREAIANLRGPM